jgi:hypothetical protein
MFVSLPASNNAADWNWNGVVLFGLPGALPLNLFKVEKIRELIACIIISYAGNYQHLSPESLA